MGHDKVFGYGYVSSRCVKNRKRKIPSSFYVTLNSYWTTYHGFTLQFDLRLRIRKNWKLSYLIVSTRHKILGMNKSEALTCKHTNTVCLYSSLGNTAQWRLFHSVECPSGL